MGQQQLLLLVLSTVIVGLATVAGIQAFSENRQQATQDALVQRALSLGADISAAAQQPTQMGGIDLGDESASDVADAIGVSKTSGISADGAGDSAGCKIQDDKDDTVQCGSDGANGGSVEVDVDVDPDAEDPVTVDDITVNS